MRRYMFTVLAYLVPTFALGFVWHLVLFQSSYETLGIYRHDIIVPFGSSSILVQGVIFAWLYENAFAGRQRSPVAQAIAYGAMGAILSWSFTTLAVAAKNVMTSVPDYLLIETAFTLVQWTVVALLTVVSSLGPRVAARSS
jgi:hypothetical protein